MKKQLSRQKINFILAQLFIFTFICVMALIDYFFSYEIKYFKMGIWLFTFITVVIYEIIVNYLYHKSHKNSDNSSTEAQQKSYNEKFLWFELILLLDIIIIVALLSQLVNSLTVVAMLLILGFIVYYLISLILKPYFGIKTKK